MSEPFLSEIRMVGFNFAPRGWALCDGQILPINQNQSLYSLLGTTYGGDGRTTFGLPDLRGRTPVHVGNGRALGQKAGEEAHALGVQGIPTHQHHVNGSSQVADSTDPTGRVLAKAGEDLYGALSQPVDMGSGMIASAGGGQGHENMQPYLALNFVIALQGVFPSRN
jgi:microcystin-dependent protein